MRKQKLFGFLVKDWLLMMHWDYLCHVLCSIPIKVSNFESLSFRSYRDIIHMCLLIFYDAKCNTIPSDGNNRLWDCMAVTHLIYRVLLGKKKYVKNWFLLNILNFKSSECLKPFVWRWFAFSYKLILKCRYPCNDINNVHLLSYARLSVLWKVQLR